MSAEFLDSTHIQIKEIIERLQSPIHDKTTLLRLLSAPLACLGLLPPPFRRYNIAPLPEGIIIIDRHIPSLQKALLDQVAPAWESDLVREGAEELLEQYFCPNAFSFSSPIAGKLILHAYSSILSTQLGEFSIRLLVKLSKAWPIDILHSVIFSGPSTGSSLARHTVSWEDCIRNIAAVPGKVANALYGGADIPSELENATYFNALCIRCEVLIASLAAKGSRGGCCHINMRIVYLKHFQNMFHPLFTCWRSW